MLSLTKATDETGGLVVVPHSHLHFEHLSKLEVHKERGRLHLDNADAFFAIPAVEHSCGPIVVPLKRGDFVIWDSRTVHCNTHPISEPPADVLNGDQLLRICAYISMSPKGGCLLDGPTLYRLSAKKRKPNKRSF